jgi:CRP/FNR family cyclic AMP-dependent transcriptional regulator
MKPMAAAKNPSKFDPKTFLATIDGGRKIAVFPKKQTIFVQGNSSDAVFYVQKGKVKLTVVSKIGKEATIGILNEGDFFGEGCLTGQTLRLCSAIAITDCSVMRIDKKSMVEGGSATPGTSIFRDVRGIFAGTEHPIRRGFG